jgi:membrane protein DedA with SNARE-associated domain
VPVVGRDRSRPYYDAAVAVASILSQITETVTSVIGDYGLYAVFLLMLVDAVLPAASEVVMVYAGAVAAGAFSDQSVTLFGHEFEPGLPAYLAMATAGTIGYLIGSVIGWAIGDYGGRPWLERHGRWLHLNAERLDRAVFRARFWPYVWLTLLGSAIWCFGFAGAGWAAGESWEDFHEAFKLVDYAVAVLLVAGIAFVGWNLHRRRRAA